jgi:hypothetical protein
MNSQLSVIDNRGLQRFHSIGRAVLSGAPSEADRRELTGLAFVFDLDPRGLSAVEIWRALAPAVSEMFKS